MGDRVVSTFDKKLFFHSYGPLQPQKVWTSALDTKANFIKATFLLSNIVYLMEILNFFQNLIYTFYPISTALCKAATAKSVDLSVK